METESKKTDFQLHSILDHHHPEHHANHVHFNEKDLETDNNSISFQKLDPEKNVLAVHLGFLQINHRYKLDLQLPTGICAALEKLDVTTEFELTENKTAMPNHCCRLIECQNEVEEKKEGKKFIQMIVEFLADKEKFLKQELNLTLDNETAITVVFTARVLGKGKGTPLLRNGIQSIGVEVDEEEESSDYQAAAPSKNHN